MADTPREPDPFDAAAEYAAGYVSDGSGDGLENVGRPKQRREPCELTPGSRQPANRRAVLPGVEMEAAAEDPLSLVLARFERMEKEHLQPLSAAVTGIRTELGSLRGELQSLRGDVHSVQQRMEQQGATVKHHSDEIAAHGKRLTTLEREVKQLAEKAAAAAKLAEDCKRSVPKVGKDCPPLADLRALQKRVDDLATEFGGGAGPGPDTAARAQEMHALKEQVKELLTKAAAPGVSAPGAHAPPPAHVLVGEAMAREKAELGLRVKLEGIVERKEGQSELQLCAAASQALSSMLGGAEITVQWARWLQPRTNQQKPRLMLGLGSEAMVRAVLSIKHAIPPKLSSDKERIMSEFGPVETAVRNVLWEEVRAYSGGGKAWVGRSCMIVDGKPQPLSERAIKAGMEALGKPRARRAPRA